MAEEVKELSVFPMGEENPFGQYFTGKSYRKALSSEPSEGEQHHLYPGVPQPLAYPSRGNRRRADAARHRGARVVPGVGEARPGN